MVVDARRRTLCVTEAGLPLTVCTLPSPQVISHELIVSAPGSLAVRFSVYVRPVDRRRPLKLSVGATLSPRTATVLPALYVPSSSVALAEIVWLLRPSA